MCMCAYCVPTLYTVWPEIITAIIFDEISCKLHFKSMTDFNLTKTTLGNLSCEEN